MSLPRLALSIAGAALALTLGATAALAATAYASTTVNVRSGAGTDYKVVDTLRPGQRVDVQKCLGTWCFVEQNGPDGWVNANYLTADYDDYDDYDDYEDFDDRIYIRPRSRVQFYPFYRNRVCFGGNNASFCFRD